MREATRAKEISLELEYRRCKADPAYFFRRYWYIQHPEKGAILFELYESQAEALEVFQRERLIVTLKSRQIGWSTLVTAYNFWLTFFFDDRLAILLSKGEREATNLKKMAAYGFKRLPEWLRMRGPRAIQDNMSALVFDNGSSIESLPSKSDPGRGRSAYIVSVDEWAFLEDPAGAWASIEPIADVGGRILGLSTANGSGTFFEELYVKALAGENGFFPLFKPWYAKTDRDDDWYAVKKATLPQWQLWQEYPSNDVECFVRSGFPFFDIDILDAIETSEPDVGVLVSGDYVGFAEQQGGTLRMFEMPKVGDTYVIGADVAEGLDHGDYSCAHVIHWRTHRIVAVWHGHISPSDFAGQLADLGRLYNTAFIGCEVNNSGLTTCKYLQEYYRYPNIYFQRTIDERTGKRTEKIGWTTSKKSRPFMLNELSTELRERTLILEDKPTVEELRRFQRDKFGNFNGSPHDDRVMSLAIAVQMLPFVSQSTSQGRGFEFGTLGFWAQTLKPESSQHYIGAHNVR